VDIHQKKEKKVLEKFAPGEISVSHVNIRQSISILVMKIIFLEFMGLITFLMSCRIVGCEESPLFIQIASILISGFKLTLFIYTIYRWVTEYYEITPYKVIHRKGLFFQKKEMYYFKHISAVNYDQSFFGRMFNYGSLTLHDWELEKDVCLYLVHNPKKYYLLLKKLNPSMDEADQTIREQVIETDEEV